MRSRFTRLAVATVGVLGLVGGITPRAEATTVSTAVFVGTASIASGLSYPCFGASSGTPTTNMNLCPWRKVNADPPGDTDPTVLTVTLTLRPGVFQNIPNGHVDFHHNRQGIVGLAALLCENAVVNVLKPGKGPAHVGECSFTIVPNPLNTVTGNCGLSGGQVVVAFTDALGNTFTLDIHFNGVAATLVLTGHAYKPGSSQTGKVVGLTLAVPVPTTPDLNNSCSRKNAKVFTLVGAAAAVGI